MNIYWDYNNQQIVTSLYSTRIVTQYDWYLRDVIPIDLVLVTSQANSTQPWAVSDLGAGESIQFGAKAAYTDAAFLFSQASWVGSGSGTTRKFTASLSLNTAALIAAVTGNTLTVIGEFVIIKPDNSNALTTQFSIVVTKDVIIGTEGTPVAAFPVIEQFTDLDGVAKVRLVNALGQTVFVGAPL